MDSWRSQQERSAARFGTTVSTNSRRVAASIRCLSPGRSWACSADGARPLPRSTVGPPSITGRSVVKRWETGRRAPRWNDGVDAWHGRNCIGPDKSVVSPATARWLNSYPGDVGSRLRRDRRRASVHHSMASWRRSMIAAVAVIATTRVMNGRGHSSDSESQLRSAATQPTSNIAAICRSRQKVAGSTDRCGAAGFVGA